MNLRRIWLAGLLALSACAGTENPPSGPPATSEPETGRAPKRERPPPVRFKYLDAKNLPPQPIRPLNVSSRCSHRDAVGTRTNLELLVRNAEVKTFRAEIAISGHGSCRFSLKSFAQKERTPVVVLADRTGQTCTVRMWEEPKKGGPRVTIAFNACAAACDGGTFDYLWPILVDAKTGRCF